MDPRPRKLKNYVAPNAKAPFETWLTALKDRQGQLAILSRLTRLSKGNLGDCKALGDIYELRIQSGPGYRVYFGEAGQELVLLLLGGDKSSQSRDIKKARAYWADYRSRP